MHGRSEEARYGSDQQSAIRSLGLMPGAELSTQWMMPWLDLVATFVFGKAGGFKSQITSRRNLMATVRTFIDY